MAFLDRSSALMTATARGRDLPRAAVEIIARLSAERTRLREEVASLRSELRQMPRPEDLAQLRAERDALARQLADAHQRLDQQQQSGAFQRLQGRQVEVLGQLAERLERAVSGVESRSRSLERLERAVARLETSTHDRPAPASATSPAPARSRSSRPAGHGGQPAGRTTRPMPRGGGMLAGLVRDNVALRSGAEPRSTASGPTRAAEARIERAPAPEPARSAARARPAPRGGGLLGNLLSENLGLRR